MKKKEFGRFVKEQFAEGMISNGYRRRTAVSFLRERGHVVVTAVAFLLLRDGRSFVPRFNIWLAPFYDDTGVMVLKDLSALVKNPPPGGSWRWSSTDSEWPRIGKEVTEHLNAEGLPWLERYGELPRLIDYLESRKRRESSSIAGEVAALAKRHEEHGIKTLRSPGLSDESNAVRPEVLQQLSYCYEATGDWAKALEVWKEYCVIFPPSDASDHRRKIKARLEYLSAKVP